MVIVVVNSSNKIAYTIYFLLIGIAYLSMSVVDVVCIFEHTHYIFI